jgi:hypothetical protein
VAGKILRASELGTYLYCARAWWYEQQGAIHGAPGALGRGELWQRALNRGVVKVVVLRLAGGIALLGAVISLALHLTWLLLP